MPGSAEGDVVFESARFKTSKSSFHNTRLPDGYLNFKNVSLESEDMSVLKIASLERERRIFSTACFGTGNLSFINADFY